MDARAPRQEQPVCGNSQESQQRKCWQHFVQTELRMIEHLSEAYALPPAVEEHLAGCVRRHHSQTLSVQDSKQLWMLFLEHGKLTKRHGNAHDHYAAITSSLPTQPADKRADGKGSPSSKISIWPLCAQSQVYDTGCLPEDVQDQIEKDIHRTAPKPPESEGRGVSALRRVLQAYAKHNPRVGYCQGMNFVAGMLLQHLSEENSFWGLAHIVELVLADYFVESMAGAVADQRICRILLLRHCPHVMQHADNLQVNIALVASQWLLTAFVNVLPMATTMRVWDVMLFEGSACVLFRAMLTIVESNIQALLSCKDSLELWQTVVSMPGLFSDPALILESAMLHYTSISESVHLLDVCLSQYHSAPTDVRPNRIPFVSCSASLQDLRKQCADSSTDLAGGKDGAACAQTGAWPVHPDVCVQLDLHNPTVEAQHGFLAQLEAEAQQAAWSLCAQVGADAAGVTDSEGRISVAWGSKLPVSASNTWPASERVEQTCGTMIGATWQTPQHHEQQTGEVCKILTTNSASAPEGEVICSLQSTRQSQRLALTSNLQNLRPYKPESGPPQDGDMTDHSRTPKHRLTPTVHSRQSQAPAFEADRVWENPTLATQLVIGCYATMYKAQGAQAGGGSTRDAMKALHLSERDLISQQQQLMKTNREVFRIQRACAQENGFLRTAANIRKQTELMKAQYNDHTASARCQVETLKASIPGLLEELTCVEQQQAEQLCKNQELDKVLGTLVSRTPRSTRSSS